MSTRDDRTLVGEDELAAVLAEHAGPPHPIANGASRLGTWRHRRGVLAAALVTLAILVGSGLGFGVGSSLTPSVSARSTGVGFGFLPARSWNVVQSGVVSEARQGRALATNVPLRESGSVESTWLATLASLPPQGIVISASFELRGDPGVDQRFPAGTLPLRIADAQPFSGATFAPDLAQYRLRAGVGGSNVDVWIFFGTQPPSADQLAAADRQLERLVVVSEQVTIAARPTIAPPDGSITLFGSIDTGKEGEEIVIQSKDCGQRDFRTVAGARSSDGGGWSVEYFPGISTSLRAVWNGRASAQVGVKQRAPLRFFSRPFDRTRFFVAVVARVTFVQKKVTIQTFDRRVGRWRLYRSIVLTEQEGRWSSSEFTARVPRGARLRAVLPRSQARPCYLPGTSPTVQT